MNQSVEPVKWPIAPDGYIPNSVIRSWRKEEMVGQQRSKGFFFPSLDEDSASYQDYQTKRVLWFADGDNEEGEEEEEMFYRVKPRKRLNYPKTQEAKEDETDSKTKNKKERKRIDVFRTKQRTETGEDELRGFVFQQLIDNQTETTVNKNMNTSDENRTVDQKKDTVKFTSVSVETSTHTPQKEPTTSGQLYEDVSSPVQSSPRKQKELSIVSKEWLKPSVESHVVSADTVVPRQGSMERSETEEPSQGSETEEPSQGSETEEPSQGSETEEPSQGKAENEEPKCKVVQETDAPTLNSPTQPNTKSPSPLKPPPPSPEILQHQGEFGSPADQDQNFLHIKDHIKDHITGQSQLALNLKVLTVYKKFKSFNKNFSYKGISPTTPEYHSTISARANALHLNLESESAKNFFHKGISPTIPEYHLTHLSDRTSALSSNLGGKSADKNLFHKGMSTTIPEYHPTISGRTNALHLNLESESANNFFHKGISPTMPEYHSTISARANALHLNPESESANNFFHKGISPTIPEYHLTHISNRTSALSSNLGGKSADKNLFHKGISPTIPEYHLTHLSDRTSALSSNLGGKSADKNLFHKGISPTIPKYHLTHLFVRTNVLNSNLGDESAEKNFFHKGISPTVPEYHPEISARTNILHSNLGGESASGASQFTAQINLKEMELHDPLPFNVKLPTIHTHPNSDIQSPHYSDPTNKPLILSQFLHTDCNKPMPEWRRTLHELIALQGFRSSHAAGRYTAEHPVEPPPQTQHAAMFPSLEPDRAAAKQRVVQKIQMTDGTEVDLCCFNHIIPLASQHSFITSHLCGTTQYGRLQFDWKRGSEDEELIVLPVKSKH